MKTNKSQLAPQTQTNKCAFNRRLKRTQLSIKCNDAGQRVPNTRTGLGKHHHHHHHHHHVRLLKTMTNRIVTTGADWSR